MIQRIQSFWLVLAACCMALCFMSPVAEYHMELPEKGQTVEARLDLIAKDNPDMMKQMIEMSPVVEYSQRMSGFHTWPLMALVIAVMAVAVASIFLFKNRILQMRIVAIGFLLNVVYVFLVFFWAVDAYGNTVAQAMGGSDPTVNWFAGAYAPIISIIFFILAHRGIKKDEAKVRAADRLR